MSLLHDELQDSVIQLNKTYSLANNTNFYAFVNPTFYDYYQRVVSYLAQWLDGYVIGFHDEKKGIFSTRLANSLVNGIANQICGKQIMFKKAKDAKNDNAVKKIDDWANESNFKQAVRDGFKYACGLGTSLLKINQSASKFWVEAVRLDYCFFATDARGNVIETYTMTKKYNNVLPTVDGKLERNYYVVEHRFFDHVKEKKVVKKDDGSFDVVINEEDIPYVEYQIKLMTGTDLSFKTYNPSMVQNVGWESIPNKVKKSIMHDYRIIKFNEKQKLPFSKSLGCALLKCNGSDISMPNAPFGTSILQNILSELISYDLAFSYFNRDMYNGKGFILAPEQFTDGNNNVFGTLSKSIYETIKTVDPEKTQPMNIQFDLRADQWESIQNTILKKIATKIGMSPKTIASYLEDSASQRTATEIDAEDDSTMAFIEIMRGVFEKPINDIIEIILNAQGESNDVKVKFATPSLVNQDKLIDRAIRKLEAGLITKKQALREIYPDEDEAQLETRYQELLAEEETNRNAENEQFQFGL